MPTVIVKGKKIKCEPGKLGEIMDKLDLSLDEYVAIKGDEIILDDEPISESDEIKLIPVISGG